ncbi:excalibur calcium-binding domain-containing protein [Actinomyces gerencseriae]
MPTVPQIVSRRPSSRLLLAGSWLITLVIVVPVLAGCGGSPAQGAPPTATASTTQVLITVPDVIGMKGDVAAETLKEAGLTQKPNYTDADGEESVMKASNWSVTAQDPAAGEQVRADRAITLTVNHDSADAAASASASASAAAAAEASASAAAAEAEPPEPAVQKEEPAPVEEPAQEPAQAPRQSGQNPDSEGAAGAYYANCTEAKAAGAAPLYRGEPGYREKLDRDKDGIACEK